MSKITLEDFDFGFTAATADELEEVQQTKRSEQTKTEEWQQKTMVIYNAVLTLLDNLAEDPEKPYLYWPNRLEKIESFREKMEQLVKE